ncbi:MAG: hypothetical protein ACR2Q4_22285, partial [Geminicoccaceae bacterium]
RDIDTSFREIFDLSDLNVRSPGFLSGSQPTKPVISPAEGGDAPVAFGSGEPLSVAPSTSLDRLGGGFVADTASSAPMSSPTIGTQTINGFTPRGGDRPIDGPITFTPGERHDPNENPRSIDKVPDPPSLPHDLAAFANLAERFKDTAISFGVDVDTPIGGGNVSLGVDWEGDANLSGGGNVLGYGGSSSTTGEDDFAMKGENFGARVTEDGVIGGQFGGTAPLAPGVGLNLEQGFNYDPETGEQTLSFDSGLRFGTPGFSVTPKFGISNFPSPFDTPPLGSDKPEARPTDEGGDNGVDLTPDPAARGLEAGPPGIGAPPSRAPEVEPNKPEVEPSKPEREPGENNGASISDSEKSEFGGSASDFGGSNGLL